MRILPGSLASRLIMFLLAALVITQVATFLIFLNERQNTLRDVRAQSAAARMATIVRLLDDIPTASHAQTLRNVSTRRSRFWFADHAQVASGTGKAEERALERRLSARLGARVQETRIHSMSDQIPSLLSQAAWADSGALRRLRRLDVSHYVSVLLPSGMWLNLEARTPLGGARWVQPVLLSMGLMGTATVVIVVIVIRRLTRPLRALAGAAEGFGRGEVVEPIPETGPPEIRSATEAFNRMSNRLSRFVQDRMQILAAISHDLRTPMASLRLQAEMIEDAETRGRIMETLDEMQRMATSTLDLAREDAAREDTRMVDLGQLVEAVCNDLSDLGHDVAVDELPGVLSRCRVVALRRALRNLIENAVAYGKRARVSVHADGGEALIVIDDDGPGIPEDEQEAVFEPFVRLEPSRAKETGGVGLGLAIARSIARSHGGDITLKNRNGNGLRATLTLPLVQEQ